MTSINAFEPYERESIDGSVIAEKTSMLMVSVTIFASATSLNVFGMDMIVMIYYHLITTILINALVIIKGTGSL